MLTNIGILASGKGMVAVPNLSGLSKTDAISAITNAGLIAIDGGSVATENSNLNNIIATQSPSSGTLVSYDTEVTYTWYTFVPAPPFFPNFVVPPFFPNFVACQTPNQTVWGECFFNPLTGEFLQSGITYDENCNEIAYPTRPCPGEPPFFPSFVTTPPFFPNFVVPPFFPNFVSSDCNSSNCQNLVDSTNCVTTFRECIDGVCTVTGTAPFC